MTNRKQNRAGISLMSLIIVILILLILAALTIAMVLSENGIIAKSQIEEATKAGESLRTTLVEELKENVLEEDKKQEGINISDTELKEEIKKVLNNSEYIIDEDSLKLTTSGDVRTITLKGKSKEDSVRGFSFGINYIDDKDIEATGDIDTYIVANEVIQE